MKLNLESVVTNLEDLAPTVSGLAFLHRSKGSVGPVVDFVWTQLSPIIVGIGEELLKALIAELLTKYGPPPVAPSSSAPTQPLPPRPIIQPAAPLGEPSSPSDVTDLSSPGFAKGPASF